MPHTPRAAPSHQSRHHIDCPDHDHYTHFSVLATAHEHLLYFFFQAEDGIRDVAVTGVQTCALPISEAGTAPSPDGAAGRRWRASALSNLRSRSSGAIGFSMLRTKLYNFLAPRGHGDRKSVV